MCDEVAEIGSDEERNGISSAAIRPVGTKPRDEARIGIGGGCRGWV